MDGSTSANQCEIYILRCVYININIYTHTHICVYININTLKMKNKYHMFNSTDTEKEFDKIQHTFMTKNSLQNRYRREYFNVIKA